MMAAQTMPAQGAAVENIVKERPVLQTAIPDDVKVIVGKWQGIVATMESPMKNYLKKARLSLGGDNRLMIVLEDGLASDYFIKGEGHKEILENLLSDVVQKQISVNFQSIDATEVFEHNYVDLSTLVQMDIEEEEE